LILILIVSLQKKSEVRKDRHLSC